MNKFIIVVLLQATFLSVCAQGNDFFIKSINTNYAKIYSIKDRGPWKSASKEAKLNNNDSLMIKSGTLKLGRNGYSPRTIYKTSPITIIDAWNGKYKKTEKPYTTIWGILSVWGIKMGEKDNDSIRFCFINTQGEWRTNDTICVKDTLEAMAISHEFNDTIYAYVYWAFRDNKSSTIFKLFKITDSPCCKLIPNYNNVFYFNKLQPITRMNDSDIYVIYTKDYMSEPFDETSLLPTINEFLDKANKKGFIITTTHLTLQQ